MFVLPNEADFINQGYASRIHTSNHTMNGTTDVGKIHRVQKKNIVFTLPNIAAASNGDFYTFWVEGVPRDHAGEGVDREPAGFKLSPNSSDSMDGILSGTVTADKDYILASDDARLNDFIVITAVSDTNSWKATGMRGDFSREA